MSKLFRLSMVVFITIICVDLNAADKTIQYSAFLGKFGIELQKNKDYTKYLNKDVLYLRKPTPDFNCPENTELIIKKISADDDKLSISLLEKNGKKKYKMEASIGYKTNYLGTKFKEDFCIDNIKTVPLLLLDEFNTKKNELVGKVLTGESGHKYQITEMSFFAFGFKILYKSLETNEDFALLSPYYDGLNLIGKIYTHPKVKGFYEIVEIKDAINKKDIKNYKIGVRYSESNTNKSKEMFLYDAEKDIFKEDLKTIFNASLVQVEKPENPDIRYGETLVVADSTVTKYRYTDNLIDILIFAGEKNFEFVLKNISNSTIKVVWDEAAYIDYNGETSKIMHKGIKYSEREASQPASVIIKGAKLEDVAIPTKNVSYSSTLNDWVTYDMLLNRGLIKLMIPIQIKDVINEYVFIFKVKKNYVYPSHIKNEILEELERENSEVN